jgi:hypothetical protein
MGITHKAISAKFLNIIIRTNHGQTEIVMQYGFSEPESHPCSSLAGIITESVTN